jgi:hypothetical protein
MHANRTKPERPEPAPYKDVDAFLERLFSSNQLVDNIRPTPLDLAYMEQHGKFFPSPSPHGFRRMKEHECYANCIDTVDTVQP